MLILWWEMKNIFYKMSGVLFLLVILLTGAGFNRVEAMVVPSITVKVIVNTVGGDGLFNFDERIDTHQLFSIQTSNGSGGYQAGLLIGFSTVTLTEATSSDWQLSNVTCTTSSPYIKSYPYLNGIQIDTGVFASATCIFTNTKIIKKNPVIIVPGIMGTEIKNSNDFFSVV